MKRSVVIRIFDWSLKREVTQEVPGWFGEWYFPDWVKWLNSLPRERYIQLVEGVEVPCKAERGEVQRLDLKKFLELECRLTDDTRNALLTQYDFGAYLRTRYSAKAVLNCIYFITGEQGRGKTCAALSMAALMVKIKRKLGKFKGLWDPRIYFFMRLDDLLKALPYLPPGAVVVCDDPLMGLGSEEAAVESDVQRIDQMLEKARTQGVDVVLTAVYRERFQLKTIFRVCEPRFISEAQRVVHVIIRERLGEPPRLYTVGYMTLAHPADIITAELTGFTGEEFMDYVASVRARIDDVAMGRATTGRKERDLLALAEHPGFVIASHDTARRLAFLATHPLTGQYSREYRIVLQGAWKEKLDEWACTFPNKSGAMCVNTEEVQRRLPQIMAQLRGEKVTPPARAPAAPASAPAAKAKRESS